MTAEGSIFHKIVLGEVPAEIVYKDEWVTAFNDIRPVAPVHVLVVPNVPVESLQQLTEEHRAYAAGLLLAIPKIAAQLGIAESGYRVIANSGPDSRQEVPYLHLHIIGGRMMQHPLG